MKHRPLVALGLALPLAAMPGMTLGNEPGVAAPISLAERRLFTEHHLQGLRAPATLRYGFVKGGSLEAGYHDQVQLRLGAGRNGGCCAASGSFLSGSRQVGVPEVEDAKANPVILYFLEHDVREMHRLTKGQPNYFRKRIRLALVDAAQLKDTVVRYQGRDVNAQEVHVKPYADDPMRARYERFAEKQYTFVLSSAVPGGVYQVRSLLPGARPADTPLLEETLTLEDTRPDRKTP